MPSPPATPAPHAASCFATEAVRQDRPEPPLPPFQPHPSPRLRQIKGGFLRSHQPPRPQEFLMGGKGRSLSFAEREEIAIWRAQRHGVREIARQLKRAPSTISRELRRNAATRSGGLAYRATTAQGHADRS